MKPSALSVAVSIASLSLTACSSMFGGEEMAAGAGAGAAGQAAPVAAVAPASGATVTADGILDVGVRVSSITYIARDSGEVVPFLFYTQSDTGRTIIGACRDKSPCRFTGTVELTRVTPPSATAAGLIAQVTSAGMPGAPGAPGASGAGSPGGVQAPSAVEVHLQSHRDERQANSAAVALSLRLPLNGLRLVTRQVDLERKGQWTRVVVTGFDSMGPATSFCTSVRRLVDYCRPMATNGATSGAASGATSGAAKGT
jgi:hypothetical protein